MKTTHLHTLPNPAGDAEVFSCFHLLCIKISINMFQYIDIKVSYPIIPTRESPAAFLIHVWR